MIGTIDYGGQMVQVFDHEYDIPEGFPRGEKVAFENPQMMDMDGPMYYQDATVYAGYSSLSSATAAPVIKAVAPNTTFSQPINQINSLYSFDPDPEPLAVGISWVIIAVCIAIVALTVAAILIGGTYYDYKKKLLISQSDDIEKEWDVDTNGDGINDAHIIKYNNGRIVSWATSDYGISQGYSNTPQTDLDPEWGPEDLIDTTIMDVLKYGAIGVTAIGLLYLGAQAYSSVKNKHEFRAPAIDYAVKGAGKAASKVVS